MYLRYLKALSRFKEPVTFCIGFSHSGINLYYYRVENSVRLILDVLVRPDEEFSFRTREIGCLNRVLWAPRRLLGRFLLLSRIQYCLRAFWDVLGASGELRALFCFFNDFIFEISYILTRRCNSASLKQDFINKNRIIMHKTKRS